MKNKAKQKGKTLIDISPGEMDEFWEDVKSKEVNNP